MELTQQVRDYANQGMEQMSVEIRKTGEIYVEQGIGDRAIG